MTRAQKVAKLQHAVADWRGAYDDKTGKWFRSPKPKAAARVRRWLEELGLEPEEAMRKIAGFAHYRKFNAWLKEIG